MKAKILLLLLAIALPLRADVESHRKAATDLLSLINGPGTMRAGMTAFIGPLLDSFRQKGAPEAMVKDLQAALEDWVDKEIRWEELAPQLAEVYMHEFSEDELNQLSAFYKTPVGMKALSRLPAIFNASAKIGQDYAKTKEDALKERVMKVMAKYQPAPETPAEEEAKTSADKVPEAPTAK